MHPLLTLILSTSLWGARATAASTNDLGWRVAACSRYLKASASTYLDRRSDRGFNPGRDNERILRGYERAQAYEIMRFGTDHSLVTQYVSVLPKFAEMLLKRRPEWDQLYFVINGGRQGLYTDHFELTVFPLYEVLLVWRGSHLVFKSFPGKILEQLLDHRPPRDGGLMLALDNLRRESEAGGGDGGKLTWWDAKDDDAPTNPR